MMMRRLTTSGPLLKTKLSGRPRRRLGPRGLTWVMTKDPVLTVMKVWLCPSLLTDAVRPVSNSLPALRYM
eukprot:1412053-Prorocentrum_lima.AAC.1